SSGALVCTPTSSSRRSTMVAERGDSALAAAATSSDPKTNAKRASSIRLHLDLDDLADPEETDRLHHDGADDHHVPERLVEQQAHLFRRNEREREGESSRQRQQHKPGEAPVGGMRSHLTQNLESFTDDVGQVVEDLGQVAAAFALNGDRRDEELHVDERDALGHLLEGVVERQAEILAIENLLELLTNGRGHLVARRP